VKCSETPTGTAAGFLCKSNFLYYYQKSHTTKFVHKKLPIISSILVICITFSFVLNTFFDSARANPFELLELFASAIFQARFLRTPVQIIFYNGIGE